MVLEPAALHLRFRDDTATSESLAPPDVGAFLRSSTPAAGPPSPPPSRPPSHLEEELGVLPGTRPADPDGPLVIFLQHPEFGIPAPGYDHSLPDLECWSVRPTTFGWIASVPPPIRGLRRTAQVLAGCLALALPTHADALVLAPATPSPPVQAPAQRPTESVPTPAAAAESTPVAAPEPAPAVTPPPPQALDPLLNSTVADAAWEGVDGFDVIVELKGGKTLRGHVGAVQTDTFTLINGIDGQVLVIAKSGVSSLRAYVPPPIPTKTGTGMIIGGSVLTTLGVPVFLTGIVFVALCPSCTYLHLPMLVIGGGALGGGIPMISRGIQRRTAFQSALQERRITPMVSRTPYGGWQGGLQVRF
ncbi:MAG: hypothetical protein H0T76_05590 [Nannocystis sp.]|nr:hypothetical protein [Nannocystis sp.]MBA3545932.1 hypothetical protein [Nannocystis sp.]